VAEVSFAPSSAPPFDTDRALPKNRDPMKHKIARVHTVAAVATGAQALGTLAVGSVALGAFALGALTIGALAIGRLAIGKAKIKRLEIDELVVRRLRVAEQLAPPPEPGAETAGDGVSAPRA